MVFSIIKLFIPREQRAEAAEMLRTVQGHLELCKDQVGSWVREHDEPCSHILYAEQWESEQAMYEHIRSSLYRRVLGAMELSSRAPEISFYFVSQIKGMELIHALRGGTQAAVTGI